MPSAKPMIVLLFYAWTLSSIISHVLAKNYFSRQQWFNHGIIFQIGHPRFWRDFQQDRNVTRHMNWLTHEIAIVNEQIKLVKQNLSTFKYPRAEVEIPVKPLISSTSTSTIKSNITRKNSSSSIGTPINSRNVYVLKLLSNEILFHGFIPELTDIYRLSKAPTIECVAVVLEQSTLIKYLFIKSANGDTDTYQMNESQTLKETFVRMNEPIEEWNNAGKHLQYYRRFIDDNRTKERIITEQYLEIKNRPKLNEVQFFDMMGQILRIKYHTDPSSLSCILENFFGNIYTCDGRLVYPHELKLLSSNNNLFVFYAVMMNTKTEKQIYPLGTNNYVRQDDQIYFLYNNHPQYATLSSTISCSSCIHYEHTIVIGDSSKTTESEEDKKMEPTPSPPIETEQPIINSQNYIVYVIASSIAVYICYSIYLSRQQHQEEQQQAILTFSGKRHSMSSRRGR